MFRWLFCVRCITYAIKNKANFDKKAPYDGERDQNTVTYFTEYPFYSTPESHFQTPLDEWHWLCCIIYENHNLEPIDVNSKTWSNTLLTLILQLDDCFLHSFFSPYQFHPSPIHKHQIKKYSVYNDFDRDVNYEKQPCFWFPFFW